MTYGVPGRGAAYLVRGQRTALIEAGTPRSADALLDALRGEDVAYVFVTHVHLDHAGAAGAIAEAHPKATIVAHPRGVRHIADPSRLIDGVRQASPDLFPLYGIPAPVPADRLHEAADGETFDLGRGIEVRAIYSPGHAPHHVCYFESESRTLFAGDAVGNYGLPVGVPLTVPPRFDVEESRATLARLLDLHPRRLAFSHFGILSDGVEAHIEQYEREITVWFEQIRALRSDASTDDEVVRRVLGAPQCEVLTSSDRSALEMCVRGALMTLSANTKE